MSDITVLGAPWAMVSDPITQRNEHPAGADDDELLARVLIASWSLATGRTLRDDVPPQLLTEDELISFWADDLIAAPAGSPARAPG